MALDSTLVPGFLRSSLVLARWNRHMTPPTLAQTLMLVVGGAAAMWVVWRIVRGIGSRLPASDEFRPSYGRLGRHAPADPCPCGQTGLDGSAASYGGCCRAGDVEGLEKDIQEYLFKDWCKRSYAGRRSSRTLEQRLADYPIQEVVLPPWVTEPANFEFPVDEKVLRSWSPLRPDEGRGSRADLSLEAENDLPF